MAGGVEGAQVSFNALIEGPYGTHRSLASYGTVMLFASGIGITHQMPYVRELLEGYNAGIVAARRVTLIWVIPHTTAWNGSGLGCMTFSECLTEETSSRSYSTSHEQG